MKNQVTFSHILAILAVLVIPLFIWGVNVEKRFEKTITNSEKIKVLKQDLKETKQSTEDKYDKILEKLQDIELQLKDKKDRE